MPRVSRYRAHHYRPLLLGAMLAVAPVQAGVYRCESADGGLAFAQFPCRGASHVKVIAITPVNVIADSALTAHEHRVLELLHANIEKRAEDRRKTNQRTQKRMARETALKAKSCARSQQQMAQLRDSKRHGYRLSESAKLDGSENRLRRAIARDC